MDAPLYKKAAEAEEGLSNTLESLAVKAFDSGASGDFTTWSTCNSPARL